jgi:single-stranded-DNA-specific exonuclease
MPETSPNWSLVAADACPEDWVKAVQQTLETSLPKASRYAAQLLWQRQLCNLEQLSGFLNPLTYEPAPASHFDPDMTWAVERILKADQTQEKVAIWGDFDADGVTATAVLWDGLRVLFKPHEQLKYYIPNRITESHGLSQQGLDELHGWGATLVITCDTGSTNGPEIDYARKLGMEVIVTDHHTLPDQRPDGVALINPRSLPPDHPLATLSGVAVAYKLLEGLYTALDTPPARSLESLVDLVAIGLIADLVELKGDCRYLAQMGLRRLQTHLKDGASSRPGVAELLALCRRTGDRPTDISFGIGPRINAVSRIHGDASFCVELLTSQDADYCKALAHDAELANTRRKALQQDVYHQVMVQVSQVDLATTQCLVLASEQWPTGILGLVAGQVSQQLGRPTVLLRIDPPPADGERWLARGSARSVKGLDLYELFKAQADLLSGFGGHPLAAGLTLPVDNIPMLRSALNRAVREELADRGGLQPTLTIDLTVTVTDLGQDLFRELKVLEPYGMGNPVPRLLIRNAWFERGFHRNLRDHTGRTVKFIKTEFQLWDDTTQTGFPGEWWGHYKDELPAGRCDVVVELDHNLYQKYHVKLVDVRPTVTATSPPSQTSDSILDWRQEPSGTADQVLPVEQIPLSWDTWKQWQKQASQSELVLAVAYPKDAGQLPPQELWQQLVGLAKFLSRTQTTVSRNQLIERLPLTPLSLQAALAALKASGFEWQAGADGSEMLQFMQTQVPSGAYPEAVQQFLDIAQEEQFRRRYFSQVPVSTLQAAMRQEG